MTTSKSTEFHLAQLAQAINTADESLRMLPLLAMTQDNAEAATLLISVKRLAVLMESVSDNLHLRVIGWSGVLAKRMDSAGVDQIRVDAGVVHAAEGFTITPNIADLLPDGVTERDAEGRYANTVARCKAAATARLVHAMKALPAYAGLVSESYDEAALAEEICGDDAPVNEGGVPIVPAALAPFLTVTREIDIVLTDPSGKEIGGGE